uniref:Myb/SANT-like domain-containing protein n=1 Tax=Oryza punctata TaxID=4537 RepID=A0A0E0M8Z2_ORYPU
MSTEDVTASWNSALEKGLVDILHDHNQPRFRAQNAWIPERWRSIVNKFNEKLPYAYFNKQQIQEKEKELKGNYKIIKNARKESSLGWNDSLSMIVAEKPVWDRILLAHPKVRKFRTKPFSLFNSLASLYEESIATEDLCFTSTEESAPSSNQYMEKAQRGFKPK